MDFELTDEQRLLQDTVRRFVDDRILPNAVENDVNHHLDLGAIEGMAELGLLGIVIPEEYGGAGLDFVCEALACEEIERGEAAFRTLISVHVGLNSLALPLSDELPERHTPFSPALENCRSSSPDQPTALPQMAMSSSLAAPPGHGPDAAKRAIVVRSSGLAL